MRGAGAADGPRKGSLARSDRSLGPLRQRSSFGSLFLGYVVPPGKGALYDSSWGKNHWTHWN